MRTGGSLDEEKLDGFLMTHSSGVKVLIAPSRPDHAAVVSVEFLREVYATLRGMFDYVVVDTPPGFTPEVIATIDNATSICMVGMLDALSLKNTKLGLETLDLMGFPSENVKLILNRARSRVGISDDEVVAIMGREPDVLVPERPRHPARGQRGQADPDRQAAGRGVGRLPPARRELPARRAARTRNVKGNAQALRDGRHRWISTRRLSPTRPARPSRGADRRRPTRSPS